METLAPNRYLTVPNAFTLFRLCCIPLFLYLLFGRDNRAGAAWLLGGLGATDWVDGWLARRLHQTSEFGKIFDPTADRLLFIIGIGGIIIDNAAPLWICWAVVIREVLFGGTVALATLLFGMKRFDVTWWGKTATWIHARLQQFSRPPGLRSCLVDPRNSRTDPQLLHRGDLCPDHPQELAQGTRNRPLVCEAMTVPAQLLYSSDHEWIAVDGTRARIGITDYAQDALGDVVYVQTPTVGAEVTAGDSFSEVESTKSVSDIYAPVSGTVVAVNEGLAIGPDALNSDPYGAGWICEIEMSNPADIDNLLDAAGYQALIDG